MLRPLSLLASQVVPTAVFHTAGQLRLLRPGRTRFVTSARTGYANRPNQAIDGARTSTSLDSQPCRPLRSLRFDTEALDRFDHFGVEVCTAIKDQVAGSGVIRERLAQLLNNPCTGRKFGHIAVKDASPVMRDNKVAVENTEGERRHGEEIHCCNRFPMVIQKGCPSLCRLRTPWRSPHPAQNSSLRNVEAQHLQFAMNAWRTPSPIVGNHPEDEFTQFPVDAFPSHTLSMPREPRPIELEPCPMPANDRLWLNEDQCPFPVNPQPPQHHPEQFVGSSKSRLRMHLFENTELLPKSQVFQEQITA